MKIDIQRILRTLIQSACGAATAMITAISADWSRQSVITAIVGFVSTILISVLMNISKQIEGDNKNE